MASNLTHEAACKDFIAKIDAAKAAGAESWTEVAAALGYKSVAAFLGRRARVEKHLNLLIPSPTGAYSRNGGRKSVAQPTEVSLIATGETVTGLKIGGVSTFDIDRETGRMQWVKTRADQAQIDAYYKALGDVLCERVVPVEPVKPAGTGWLKELLVAYPIGDLHVGMLAWAKEVGADWNLKLAEKIQCAAMASLVDQAPAASQAVIINLGDWLHYDSMESKTPEAGHHLDADSRFGKMIEVAERIMLTCIDHAIQKHRHVRVVNVRGNHDPTGSQWMARTLAARYAKEPRVTVDINPSLYTYIEHGKTLIGAYHGHKTKPQQLPSVMAARASESWGRTKYRYWYIGHVHHQRVTEFPGCFVESFNTLAGKDAYAHDNGYESQRNMKCITLHKQHGEVGRCTVNAAMFGG